MALPSRAPAEAAHGPGRGTTRVSKRGWRIAHLMQGLIAQHIGKLAAQASVGK